MLVVVSSLVTSWMLAKFTSVTKSTFSPIEPSARNRARRMSEPSCSVNGQRSGLLVPGVVEFQAAADVEAERLVRAFQHGAIVPIGVQPRSLVGIGRLHRGDRLRGCFRGEFSGRGLRPRDGGVLDQRFELHARNVVQRPLNGGTATRFDARRLGAAGEGGGGHEQS